VTHDGGKAPPDTNFRYPETRLLQGIIRPPASDARPSAWR
jgi:hypothetical protein